MTTKNSRTFLDPRFKNAFAFLRKGYTFRELFFKALELKIYSRILSYLRYPLASRGRNVEIDHRAVIDGCRYISLGDAVILQRGAWLAVPLFDIPEVEPRLYLSVGNGTRIGPNCTISAAHRVEIGADVLFGPNVLVVDHAHEYRDPAIPVSRQGIVVKGGIRIGDGSWIGANAIIYAANGDLVLGEHSIVAGNAFVRENVPPFTLVAGNPARPVRRYDPNTKTWVEVSEGRAEQGMRA